MIKKIPRGRAKDTIEDLNADDMLTSGKPWVKPRQRKKKEAVVDENAKKRRDEVLQHTMKRIDEMAKFYKPRPSERIPEILNVIKELWEMQPDTRLGQLLLNNAFRKGDYHDSTNQEMYAQEDTESLDNLLKALKKAQTIQAKNNENKEKA